MVATASHDRTGRLWDVRTGNLLLTLEGHTGPVVGVVLAKVDGRPVVATAGPIGPRSCGMRVVGNSY